MQQGSGGLVFHVMNHAVRGSKLFETHGDFVAFLEVVCEVQETVPMRILVFALMHTHWHMVLWPREDADLTQFVGSVTHIHACRWNVAHETRGEGAVYKGRFRAIPVDTNQYLFIVCRYVERNAVRARLVSRAEQWRYSSAAARPCSVWPALHPWPMPKPESWAELINEPEPQPTLDELRKCLSHDAPFGTDDWCKATAAALGWTRGIRPPGRPRKE